MRRISKRHSTAYELCTLQTYFFPKRGLELGGLFVGLLLFDVVAREDAFDSVLRLALPPTLVSEFVNVGDALTFDKALWGWRTMSVGRPEASLQNEQGGENALSSPSSAASYSYSATATIPSSTGCIHHISPSPSSEYRT